MISIQVRWILMSSWLGGKRRKTRRMLPSPVAICIANDEFCIQNDEFCTKTGDL